jgi:MFS family permease
MTAALFGRNPLGTLYGYLLCSHSLGALLGPYVAGAVFDRWGRYDAALFLDAAFLAAASLCCLALNRKGSPSGSVASQ